MTRNRSRALRRAEKNYHKTLAAKSRWDDQLEDRTVEYKKKMLDGGVDPRTIVYWGANNVLSVGVHKVKAGLVMSFRLNTQGKDIPWAVKTYFKNLLGYENRWGFEAFPPPGHTTDAANMYWISMPDEPKPDLHINFSELFPKLLTDTSGA